MELSAYKQEIADLYSRRSATYDNYDNGAWHSQIANRLVELANLQPGQRVLDTATGTGMVAIAASPRVGCTGHVIGIDISTGMLEQAQHKAKHLSNVEFQLADAEALPFSANSFDVILCSSAFIWMTDLQGALRHWHQLLKPGGLVGFHAFSETAFVASTVAQQVYARHEVEINLSKPTGSIEKCYALLATTGYESIQIYPEQNGSYLTLEHAQSLWMGNTHPTPGQYPHPASHLSPEQLEHIKAEFDAALEALMTDQGIWNDVTIFYTFGRKPS